MYYAVIDTNVFVSSLITKNREAATVLIIDELNNGELVPVYSEELLKEYIEVLSRAKFSLKQEQRDCILDIIMKKGVLVKPEKTDIPMIDEKDRMFVEAALGNRKNVKTFIVTGNLKHFEEMTDVLNPRGMIDFIQEQRNCETPDQL